MVKILICSWIFVLVIVMLVVLGGVLQVVDIVCVGLKIDIEGLLLGNIIVQVFDVNGIKIINKLQLGIIKVVCGVIIVGEIDIYFEYMGNGVFFFFDEKDFVWKDVKVGYEKVKVLDYEKNKLVWFLLVLVNNIWIIVVCQDLVSVNNLKILDDLGKWINVGGKFKLVVLVEFIERFDVLFVF